MTKTYTLTVFNTCTSRYEDIEVSREIYNEFRRGEWRIEKNDDKHRANETPFSELIGGDDGAFENFSEFIDNSLNPECIFAEHAKIKALYSAMSMLSDVDRQLLRALFFDGLTEREYAELTGVFRNAVHKRKVRILAKLKKFMEIDL
jgi:RNA polymerase sigma factor (sigma-70 family)